MYQRIKNSLDVEIMEDFIKLDRIVIKRIEKLVALLDEAYGCCRASYDLGGYVLLFTEEQTYEKFLPKIMGFYHLNKNLYEYSELIESTEDHRMEWHEELFLLSSDDAIILIYPTTSQKATDIS